VLDKSDGAQNGSGHYCHPPHLRIFGWIFGTPRFYEQQCAAMSQPLNIVYINPSKPRTAKKDLESLIKSIPKGELLICDPYYGLRTLEVLEVFAKYHKRIKFLTARVGGGEKQTTLSHAVSDFKKEYDTKVELRLASSKDLHDRYIVGSNHILIVGHGIKDLGSKESLIVVVEDRYGKDIRRIITTNFNVRWASAAAI
jgi:hypothetical protein